MSHPASRLYLPAFVAWTGYAALASVALSASVAPFAAGYLAESGPVRDAALWLWPDAWITERKDAPEGLAAVLAYLAAAGVCIGAWGWAMRAARGLRLPGVGPLLLLTALILTPLLAMPRLQSSDVFLYDMYGRIISVHGANPILEPPLSFPQEPLLSWVVWDYVPSSYGPLWLMLSAGVSALFEPSITGGVVGYRLAGLLVHLATAALLWRLLCRHRPEAAVAGTVFYAWNPLVLLEVVGNTHNDGLVALCAVALTAAALQKRWVAAAVAGACAVMVKPFAVVLFPVLARQIAPAWREPAARRRLVWPAMAAAAAALVVSLPLWAGLGLIRNVAQNPAATDFANSLWELAAYGVTGAFAIEPAQQRPFIGALRAALFLGGLTWLLSRPVADRGLPASVVHVWTLFCLCAAWVWPWYLVPALALAPAAGDRLLSIGAGLTIGGLLFWAAWPEARPWPLDEVYPWRSLLLFGPAGLVAAWAPARAVVLGRLRSRRGPEPTTGLSEEIPLEAAPG